VVAASANAKSGKGGRWLLIGVMAVMLVIAVSAAGLFLAVPMLKDAPFLRDAPFLKDASFLKNAVDEDAVASDSTMAEDAAAGETPARVAESESGAGTFETSSDTATEKQSSDSSLASDVDAEARTDEPPPTNAAGLTRSLAGASASSPRAENESSGSSAIAERAPAPAAAPPRRAPIRESPRIAVVAVGEPMFAGAAEQALETQLGRHGLDLYDERGILELRDVGGAGRVAPSSLLGMVAGRGVDVLVLIDVEPMSERELDALGRYATATTSRIRVDAYLAADGDAIGRGWSEQVEYAQPNAASKADAAMGGFSTAIAEAIDTAWRDHRAGAR
jgi:hypothetical protein